MRIEVEIDELILDDVSPAERLRVAQALETELERLLAAAEPGVDFAAVTGNLDVPFVDAGSIDDSARQHARAFEDLGTQVARTLYGSLQTEGSNPASGGEP